MALKTTLFDAAEYLDDDASQAELLSDAFGTGDAGYIANALGVVARARGMTTVAKEAGVTREALYRSLSPEGDPRLTTLLGTLKAIGLNLAVVVPDGVPVATKPQVRNHTRYRALVPKAHRGMKPDASSLAASAKKKVVKRAAKQPSATGVAVKKIHHVKAIGVQIGPVTPRVIKSAKRRAPRKLAASAS